MQDNGNKNFNFTYSAPTEAERREIESIRRQYKTEPDEISKVERLRRLHSRVTGTATAVSLAVGIFGILLFGLGLSLVLEFNATVLGIILAAVGVFPIAAALPLYKSVLNRGRKQYGEEILRLSDELLGESN